MGLRMPSGIYDCQVAEGNDHTWTFEAWRIRQAFCFVRKYEKGKPVERRGRKAMELNARLSAQARQAAELELHCRQYRGKDNQRFRVSVIFDLEEG